MRSEEESNDMYARLMAISNEAFAGQHFEVAYHALAAAMHWARDSHAMHQIKEVELVAQQQLDWIDKHAPAHPVSSQSAHMRGNQSIFRLLAHQAATQVHLTQLKRDTQDNQ